MNTELQEFKKNIECYILQSVLAKGHHLLLVENQTFGGTSVNKSFRTFIPHTEKSELPSIVSGERYANIHILCQLKL